MGGSRRVVGFNQNLLASALQKRTKQCRQTFAVLDQEDSAPSHLPKHLDLFSFSTIR